MKALLKSAQWLVACGIVGLAACSGKLHAGNPEPSGAGGGSGGSHPRAEDAPVVGALAHCPSTQPSNGDTCDVERASCGYADGEMNYWECYCAESPTLELGWYCLGRGTRNTDCPVTPVTPGKDCTGHFDSRCSYPIGQQCTCDGSETWDCFNIRPADLPNAPSSPAPSTPINALSEADRSAWCDWFELAMIGETPEDAPVEADGRLMVSCGVGYGPACNVAFPQLSPGQCAQNLALSSCAAPIADLSDCITTTQNGCVPEPHGCARLMASPGCSGTIVTDLGPMGASAGGTGSLDLFKSRCDIRVQ